MTKLEEAWKAYKAATKRRDAKWHEYREAVRDSDIVVDIYEAARKADDAERKAKEGKK